MPERIVMRDVSEGLYAVMRIIGSFALSTASARQLVAVGALGGRHADAEGLQWCSSGVPNLVRLAALDEHERCAA
jgi:hypothetical protein